MNATLMSIFEWLLAHLPSWLSRWYWTEERLSKGIKFDLRPRGNPIEVWFCSRNKFELIMEIENRNRVPVVIDRILANFTFESKAGPIPIQHLERLRLAPDEHRDHLSLTAYLSHSDKKRLWEAFQDEKWTPRGFLEYKMEVDTRLRSFTKSETLQSINHIKPVNTPQNIEDLF